MLILYEIYKSVQIGTVQRENLFSDFHLEILPPYLENPGGMN